MAIQQNYGTGRRKTSAARVFLRKGKGEIIVNGKKVVQYFARPVLRMLLTQPFLVADRYNQFDVYCTVTGGGLAGGQCFLQICQGAGLSSRHRSQPLLFFGFSAATSSGFGCWPSCGCSAPP